jgi:hypothetical protein
LFSTDWPLPQFPVVTSGRPPKLKRQTSPDVIVCMSFCIWLAEFVGVQRKVRGSKKFDRHVRA